MLDLKDIAFPTAAFILGAITVIVAIIRNIQIVKVKINLSKLQAIFLFLVGAIFIAIGITSYTDSLDAIRVTLTPLSPLPPDATPTLTHPPTETSKAVTSTPTPRIIATPTTTVTPNPGEDWSRNCINSNIWVPKPEHVNTPDLCLSLNKWGISAQDGGLLLLKQFPQDSVRYGVLTKLPENVDIEFTIHINNLSNGDVFFEIWSDEKLNNSSDHLFINFTSSGDLYVGRRYSNVEKELDDIENLYKYPAVDSIRFSINKIHLNMKANKDEDVDRNYEIPFNDRWLYIGYQIGGGGKIFVQIDNFKFQEK